MWSQDFIKLDSIYINLPNLLCFHCTSVLFLPSPKIWILTNLQRVWKNTSGITAGHRKRLARVHPAGHGRGAPRAAAALLAAADAAAAPDAAVAAGDHGSGAQGREPRPWEPWEHFIGTFPKLHFGKAPKGEKVGRGFCTGWIFVVVFPTVTG